MPFSYKEVKISLIVLLLLFALVNTRNYLSTPINKNILFVFSIYIVTNCLFVLIGILNNNIGVWRTLPVNLIWPILYFIILLDARLYVGLNDIELIFKISLAIIIFYVLIFYSNILFGSSISINQKLIQLNFDPNDSVATAYQIAMPAATSLFFLVPFFISKVLISEKKKLSDYLLLTFGVLISFATGRRALILLTIFSPLMILMLSFVLPYRNKVIINRVLKMFLIIFLLMSVVVAILEKNKIIDTTFIINKTITYFIPSKSGLENGAIIRNAQKNALIDKWKQRPILGFGYGASVENYIRNEKTSWAYELTYIAKLMNTGIIGVSIYLFFISFLFINLFFRLKDDYVFYLSSIAGFIAVLVANGSNPYLDSFEYMWMIYFQIFVILIQPNKDIKSIYLTNSLIM